MLSAKGYNHIGDIDVVGKIIWAPIERQDKTKGEQIMARYDLDSLKFIDFFVVPQHHNAFVTIDPDSTFYSADQFDDDTLLRYKFVDKTFRMLRHIKLSRRIDHIQGGDIAEGALWLSTDDDHNGLYRVDLTSGAVEDLGSMGHSDGDVYKRQQ